MWSLKDSCEEFTLTLISFLLMLTCSGLMETFCLLLYLKETICRKKRRRRVSAYGICIPLPVLNSENHLVNLQVCELMSAVKS